MDPLKNNRGITLVLTIVLMTLIMFLALYFLNSSMSERQISVSQSVGERTYYLAESGIADMIWKLKNDPAFKDNFEINPSWTATITKADPFGPGSGSYTVSINNTGFAHGDIVSTGSIDLNGKASQRVIKTKVFKAMGQSVVGENAVYADGNVDVSSSIVNYYNGGTHSNGNYIINGASTVNVDKDMDVNGNFLDNIQATVNIGGVIHAANYPPAAPVIPMPAVDFNSSATTSMKNRADVIYTHDQFENLIKNNSDLTLNGPIIYVSGDVEIEKSINLTINGLLVILGEFELDSNDTKTINVTINHASGTPAGIMVAEEVEIKKLKGVINIGGVIYANDKIDIINITSPLASFNITGGFISRKTTITGCTVPINIYYDSSALSDSFISTEFSPVITVEHWEEEY